MTSIRVSAITATTAHWEWAARLPDERFTRVHALYDAARARRQRIDERLVDTGDFSTEADDDDLVIHEASDRTDALTHWSSASSRSSPARRPTTRRTQPAAIASNAINDGLQRIPRDQHQLFVGPTAPWTVRRSPRRSTHASTATNAPVGCSTSWPSPGLFSEWCAGRTTVH